MRAELVAVTEKAVAVRGNIMLEKSLLREIFAELNNKGAKERVNEQEMVLRYAHVRDERIKKLQLVLKELEKKREEKIKEIVKIRKYRKGLEKLRESAKTDFINEQEHFLQKQLDDGSNMSFARKIIQHS